MALSMDEQRALAEIERRLAADDPGLATCLTAFRRPGPARVLRSPRARIIGSLFTVLLVAMVSLMVYAMIPFRAGQGARVPAGSTAGTPGNTAIVPAGSAPPQSRPPASSNPSASVSASTATGTPSAAASTPSASAKASQAKDQAAGPASSRAAGP
jgi:predicted lipid-binding transport protein (Tim44 family)